MKHFRIGRIMAPLGITGAQELVAEADGQIAVDDDADVGTPTDEIGQIAQKQFGRFDRALRRGRSGMGPGREE